MIDPQLCYLEVNPTTLGILPDKTNEILQGWGTMALL